MLKECRWLKIKPKQVGIEEFLKPDTKKIALTLLLFLSQLLFFLMFYGCCG
jgi:hypothetical protein